MALPWDSSKADNELCESTDTFTLSETVPAQSITTTNRTVQNYAFSFFVNVIT